MAKGRIEFILRGNKLKGALVLTKLRQKEREWLLIKKNDECSPSRRIKSYPNLLKQN